MSRLALALVLFLVAAPAFGQGDERRAPIQAPPVPKASNTSLLSTNARPIGSVGKGDRAPDFELDAVGGMKVKLSALRGSWVAVCFYPRKESAVEADSLSRVLKSAGVTVVAVVAERLGVLGTWAAKHPSGALLLADPFGDIASLYGSLDTERNTPLPGFALVDPKGVVRVAALGRSFAHDDAVHAVQYAIGTP